MESFPGMVRLVCDCLRQPVPLNIARAVLLLLFRV